MRKKKVDSTLFGICMTVLLATSSQAAVTVFINDQAGFNLAVANAGLGVQGTENFESSVLGAGLLDSFPGPLAPGVPSTPNPGPGIVHFPNGTNVATGMTVSTTQSAMGAAGTFIAVSSVGALGGPTPNDQIGNVFPDVDMNLSFAIPPAGAVSAVSFAPLFIDAATGDGTVAGPVSFQVFDSSDTQMGGTNVVAGANFTLPYSFVGLVGTGGMDIGRIRLIGDGTNFIGVDNITVHNAVPEPSAFLFLGLVGLPVGMLHFFKKRRRKLSKD